MKPEQHAEPDAERAVLGGVLADPRQLGEVATTAGLKAEDFFVAAHGLIYAAALALDAEGRPLDPMTVGQELKRRGELDRVGGLAYLAELDTAAPMAANAVEYARAVTEASGRRRLHALLTDLLRRNLAGREPVGALVGEASLKLGELAHREGGKGPEKIAAPIERTLEALERLREQKTGVTGLATGCDDLDQMLTGLHPGELLILAARPGVGKSAAGMQWAAHVGVREKKAALVFSLEMPIDQLVLRMLSSESKVSLKRLRQGGLTPLNYTDLNDAAANLYGAPIYIDDSGSLTPLDVRTRARRLKAQDPSLGLIVIDYLQLMAPDARGRSREEDVAQVSRSLKQLAKELRLPILALAQLNRKVEERKDGRPVLSDLRESGGLEQDSDVVMFLHPTKPDEGERPVPGVLPVDLLVAKQRNGPTGDVRQIMQQEYVRFDPRSFVAGPGAPGGRRSA